MALIVQKFGGSSVKDRDRIFNVARIVANTHNAGNDVVVVVSAQGDTTDDLITKAAEITHNPSAREMDMLLAAGEEISIALLAMALNELGCHATSLTGWQAGFRTDRAYTKARITKLETERISSELERNRVVVVAGFQGLNKLDDITTLGRGGSDTSAVAIAAALHADRCQIFTDVEGVYTADPRKVRNTRKLDEITFDEMLELEDIRSLIKPRQQFAHKGNFGHALLIAGSKGMAGASVLAARACLRSGVGLLTVHAPICNNDILQTSVPEAMVETDANETCFAIPTDTDDYQAVGIGPGLGRSEETEAALLEQLEHCQTPVVVDADALNILANHRHTLTHLPKGSILTPHPKELERLTGKCQDSYERLTKACELAHAANVHIILKGAYSAIITPAGKCYFNPTGNPGMATGGSGDVLTGVILALLAQGYPAEDAAKIGTYIHGLAGDFAQKKQGMIGLIASDIITCLPTAWRLVSE